MNRKLIIVLFICLIILIVVNVNLFLVKKICTYEITEQYYYEKISVEISRFNNIEIVKSYEFNDEDIMDLEIKNLDSNGYEVSIADMNLVARKTEKNNGYYKNIKKYSELGFMCK